MKLFMIRHGATAGNLEKRYIGTTDEALSREGIALLENCCREGKYPDADHIFVSPMKRCIQTARIIYPGREYTVIEGLSECDFGSFENKNYEELKENPLYQPWIDSGGRMPFPGGESREAFSERCVCAFARAVELCSADTKAGAKRSAAFIIHGGTIMSIMEKYAVPKGEYYDFQIGNGEGYELILPDNFPNLSSVLLPDRVSGGSETFAPDDSRICAGLDFRRPSLAVPSGPGDWETDYSGGKNYKKLFA